MRNRKREKKKTFDTTFATDTHLLTHSLQRQEEQKYISLELYTYRVCARTRINYNAKKKKKKLNDTQQNWQRVCENKREFSS